MHQRLAVAPDKAIRPSHCTVFLIRLIDRRFSITFSSELRAWPRRADQARLECTEVLAVRMTVGTSLRIVGTLVACARPEVDAPVRLAGRCFQHRRKVFTGHRGRKQKALHQLTALVE